MKFKKSVTPTIMDGEVVRWEGDVNYANKPEISASRNGVSISGAWPIMKPSAIDTVVSTLNIAITEHLRLNSNQ